MKKLKLLHNNHQIMQNKIMKKTDLLLKINGVIEMMEVTDGKIEAEEEREEEGNEIVFFLIINII